ncbi:kinesin-like protein KIN-4A isoform X3 [Tanacetum coccineum]
MFGECVSPLVDGLFQGYNATVLAYGQVRARHTPWALVEGWVPNGACSSSYERFVQENQKFAESNKIPISLKLH